jgi:ABC-2 type transport system ATP-binding protein
MILQALKQAGKTIFFNSHLLPDVHEVCDRVGVMNQGRLIAQESVARIAAKGGYRELEQYFLRVVSSDNEAGDSSKGNDRSAGQSKSGV